MSMSTEYGVIYAMSVPPGYERDPSELPHNLPLVVVASAFYALATIAVIIRVYARAVIMKQVDLDDYVMMLAWIFATATTGCALRVAAAGAGKHLWNVPLSPDLYPNFALPNLLAATFYCAATGLAKSSILLLYLRIFPNRNVRIAVCIALCFTMGFSIAGSLVNIFSCHPIAGNWDIKYVATAKCVNAPAFYLAQAGLSIATDIITVAIPLPVLRTLQLRPLQKAAVGLLLSLGACVCIVSIIRLKSLQRLLTSPDLTKNTVLALMWCMLELNLSIFGGCVPSFKPFVRNIFPNLLGSSGRDSQNLIYLQSGIRRRPQNVMSLHGSTLSVSSNGKAVVTAMAMRSPYDPTESEERIVQLPRNTAGRNRTGQIVKTITYTHQVEEASAYE